MWDYYKRWLTMAFRHSLGVADALATMFGMVAKPVFNVVGLQNSEKILGDLTWQVLTGGMAAIIVARLVVAPNWMHQEDEAKRDAERVEEERRRSELCADRDRSRTSLAALSYNRQKREEQKQSLSGLLRDGKALRDERISHAAAMKDWMGRHKEWIGRVESEVGEQFSIADATRLVSSHFETKKFDFMFDGSHQRALSRMSVITEEIQAMFRQLPINN